MTNTGEERRKFPRYDTELKVSFSKKFDVELKVKFKVLKSGHQELVGHKYSGVSENVSASGLCFMSGRKLDEGDELLLDVFEPKKKDPVRMEGRVCWSVGLSGGTGAKSVFRTGVELISVKGKAVAEAVYFDKGYNVMWSPVLDSLFGDFAALIREMKKKRRDL